MCLYKEMVKANRKCSFTVVAKKLNFENANDGTISRHNNRT